MNPSRHPAFDRPPIAELVIGVQFFVPNPLGSAHLGRFWDRVAAEFPYTEDHAPLGLPGEWGMSKEGLPLPRVWLVSADGTSLIQLQVNRFQFNWRRMKPADAYPSFDQHLAGFMDYWLRFVDFIAEVSKQELVVRAAEVLKSSHITDIDGFNSVHRVIPALATGHLADEWAFANIASVFEMIHAEGKVRADLKSGLLTADPTRKVLLLELRSETTHQEDGKLAAELHTANELANLAFTSITAQEVQIDAWKRSR